MSISRGFLVAALYALAFAPVRTQESSPQAGSTLLFTIPEHGLYPDNIAFDPVSGDVVGDSLVFVATSFAEVPRNAESPVQHPAVLIHKLRLR